MRIIGIVLIIVSVCSFGLADEGMWQLSQINDLELEEMGLELTAEEIYNPSGTSVVDAIVWLGGCSASFVSPDGLLLTNHHCAYGALQRASSKSGNDYIKDGFLAKNKEDELQTLGTNAYVLQEMTDVTDQIFTKVKDETDPVAREEKIKRIINSMVEETENGRDDAYVKIASNFKGAQYMKYVFKKYRDVRIVYAPPASIGKYGGDIDNWMWPRHTGDFTFLRVYMAPDGSGAKYSPDNIPVKPKNYLRVAKRPLKEGDFTFILGFPGSTTRWRTSHSIEWYLHNVYAPKIKEYAEILELMDRVTADDSKGKIKLASFKSGVANVQKNYLGKYEGMIKTNFLQKRQEMEKKLTRFISENERLKNKYGNVLSEIKKEYEKLALTNDRDDIFSSFRRTAGTMLSIANQAYRFAREMAKPVEQRKADFSISAEKRKQARLRYRFLSFYEPFDKEIFARLVRKAGKLDERQKIEGFNAIFEEGSIRKYVDKAYENTKLKDPQFAMSLFEKTPAELEELNDPFINLAADLYDDIENYEKVKDASAARLKELRQKYMEVIHVWNSKPQYPDANGTIRFTYGSVKGYQPEDAVTYKPFTTLAGVIEKNTGQSPFDMPEKLAELHNTRNFGNWIDPNLKDVPVAFTHMCDITGGNSGSAVLNGKGELIGLAFDGNYEAMTGDWQYDYNLQRTITVDIRYVLFITEKFAGADYIIKEMGLN